MVFFETLKNRGTQENTSRAINQCTSTGSASVWVMWIRFSFSLLLIVVSKGKKTDSFTLQLNHTKHSIVNHVLIVGLNTLARERLTMVVFDLLYS